MNVIHSIIKMKTLLILPFLFELSLCMNGIPVSGKLQVFLNKCCKSDEILSDIGRKICKPLDGSDGWSPKFLPKKRSNDVQVHLITGFPKCVNSDLRAVYDISYDRLRFLTDGTFRHFISKDPEIADEDLNEEMMYHDYKEGTYCSDIHRADNISSSHDDKYFAYLCVPEVKIKWTDADFILRKIVDPIFHIIALICYVTVAHIHFVLPQLRDLFGNIVATVNICLAIGQAADTARIITNFGQPMTHFVADVLVCVSILSAYLWLTGLGFYLWRTFRSENVFLRMTHGKKYCYYSCCIWASTLLMTVIALFAHYFLDNPLEDDVMELMKIGWLVVAIFYLPIAFCLFVNAYFYQKTSASMKAYGKYGRIHHKFKICVEIFGRLHLAMCVYWAFLAVSWLPFNGIYYSYIFVNVIIAPVILYISVLSQRRVRFLLRKECCFEKCFCQCLRPNQSDDVPEWGEEMMAIYRNIQMHLT